MSDPLVSVVITSYNYGAYLAEAINSVISQSYSNLEVLIVDDGSTDDSVDVARAFVDPRIHVISQQNAGVAAARNQGIVLSSGEFLVFVDADDTIPVNYIESNVQFLIDRKLDVASTDLILFDDEGERRDPQPEFSLERMKQGNIVHVSSMIRRSCIKSHVFDTSLSGRTHEDWDFFLGLALQGARIERNPAVALLYRQHEGSRNNHEDSDDRRIEYARLYRDVLHKYALQYPDELGYLSSTRFANLVTYMNDVLVPKAREEESLRTAEVIAENLRLVSTKEYKIGSMILKLPRAVLHRVRHRS